MCVQTIQPNAKINSMWTLMKIWLALTIALFVTKLFLPAQTSFLDLYLGILLGLTIYTLNYLYAGFYILFALYNEIYQIVSIATFFQVLIFQSPKTTTWQMVSLGLDTFILCFNIYAICVIFPWYKEMKAVAMGNVNASGNAEYNPAPRDDVEQANNNNNNNNNNAASNNRGFVPFSGSGVRIGGN